MYINILRFIAINPRNLRNYTIDKNIYLLIVMTI